MKSPSFNTASGKYCCNVTNPMTKEDLELLVSIPQAVSTVATYENEQGIISNRSCVSIPQAVSTVATS